MKELVTSRPLVLLIAGAIVMGALTLGFGAAPKPDATVSMGFWEAAARGFVSAVMVNETFSIDGHSETLPAGIEVTNTADVPVVISEEPVLMSPLAAQSPQPNLSNTTANAALSLATIPAHGSLLFSYGQYVLAGYLSGPMWWDLEQARDFMRRNIVDTEPQIRTESLRYAADVPAQALGDLDRLLPGGIGPGLGGVAVAAHPYRFWSGIGEAALRKAPFPAYETSNARTLRRGNVRARERAREARVGETGGSDSHFLDEAARAVTVFEGEGLSVDEVLQALGQGRTTAQGKDRGVSGTLRYVPKAVSEWMLRGMRRI